MLDQIIERKMWNSSHRIAVLKTVSAADTGYSSRNVIHVAFRQRICFSGTDNQLLQYWNISIFGFINVGCFIFSRSCNKTIAMDASQEEFKDGYG
jgi:hypothetical protein